MEACRKTPPLSCMRTAGFLFFSPSLEAVGHVCRSGTQSLTRDGTRRGRFPSCGAPFISIQASSRPVHTSPERPGVSTWLRWVLASDLGTGRRSASGRESMTIHDRSRMSKGAGNAPRGDCTCSRGSGLNLVMSEGRLVAHVARSAGFRGRLHTICGRTWFSSHRYLTAFGITRPPSAPREDATANTARPKKNRFRLEIRLRK